MWTAASAAEVAFIGGDASNPTNLSLAANWSGGVRPGREDVGVIDSDACPCVVIDSSLALSGLKITGTQDVTLGGPATLTLGAGGILRTAAGNLSIRCPIATCAAQTWDIADGATINFHSSISGSEDLEVANFRQYVHHYTAVGYDGQITYRKSSTIAENKWILYSAAGKWADAVKVAAGTPVFLRPPSDATVNWSDIFPKGQPCIDAPSANFGLAAYNGAMSKVVFKDGDALTFPSGSTPYYMTVNGTFEQTGGTISKEDQYFLSLGHHSTNPRWTYDLPSVYSMSGGSLSVGTVLIGYGAKRTNGDDIYFSQTGGTVKAPYSYVVGGGVQIGGGASSHFAVAEYRMSGGTLDMTAASGESVALGIASPRANATTMPAAGFVLSGGTVLANWLTFGGDKGFWNASLDKITDAYGLLDITGGELQIASVWKKAGSAERPDDWAMFSSSWNRDAEASNCVYAVKLHGGKVRMLRESQYAWPLQTCLPKSAAGTSFGYDNKDYLVSAPLYGTGVLRKDGTGTLLVKDAARFTGKVEVNGGTLEFAPHGEEDIDPDKCFRWLASSLSGLDDSAPVVNWKDVNFGVIATTNENPKYKSRSERQGAPTFSLAGVGGRPAVHFDGAQAITVSKAENPLWRRTGCTVVAVVRPVDTTTMTGGRYNRPVVSMMPGSSLGYVCFGGFGDDGGSAGWRPGVGRRWLGDAYSGADAEMAFKSRSGVSCADGDIHAFAITLDGNRATIAADGDSTNAVWSVAADVAPFGCYNNSGYFDAEKASEMGRLFFGGHVVDNVDGAFFRGDILELRIYTNRLFTATEQLKVTRRLLAEYGGDRRLMKLAKSTRATGAPGAFAHNCELPAPVATAAAWDADDIEADDGEPVKDWASTDGSRHATTEVSFSAAPKLVKGAINGHAALRFERSTGTALGIASADSPVTGSKSFTAAVVWRTETGGTSTATTLSGADAAAGLLSTKQSVSADCFSMFIVNRTAVSAGYGCASRDTDIFTRKPYRLDDGEVHISILACDGDSGKYRLMTDGCFLEGSLAADGTERGAFDTMIGVMRKGASSPSSYFDGDIAAVRLYGTALSKDAMRDLGEHWAKKYATHLLVGYKYGSEHLKESGLAATDVTVAEGARLSLPLSDMSPYTLGSGAKLAGAGEFLGTYRFADGSVFDLSAMVPTFFDELNLAGGATVRVARATLGAHVRRLVVSGANAIDLVADADDLNVKETLLTFDEAEIDDGATWTVRGCLPDAEVRVDMRNRRLVLRSPRGFRLIIR